MENKVLIAYATKYGATGEIAEKIGQVLQDAGLLVDVRRAEKVNDLSGYGAVVLGSAVYVGQWRKEAIAFLEAYEKLLVGLPVWLFSSGPTGTGDPLQLMNGWRFPEAQKPLADRIQPRDIALFHGEIDPKKINLAEKLVVRGVKAPIGDFREWQAITAWAEGIAKALK